jgi:hypothetical protein
VHSVVYALSLCLVLGGVVCLLLLCLTYREHQNEVEGNHPKFSHNVSPPLVSYSFCIMCQRIDVAEQ